MGSKTETERAKVLNLVTTWLHYSLKEATLPLVVRVWTTTLLQKPCWA